MITDAKLILKVCELYRIKQNAEKVAQILGLTENEVNQIIIEWAE